jgi:membrane protein implicated in regulation of membrane protease activity
MPEIRDAADAVLLGLFFFGLLLTLATLLLGAADLGIHHFHADGDSGPLHAGLGTVMVFLTWLGGVGFVLRRALEAPLLVSLPIAAVAGVGIAALVQRAIGRLSDPTGSVLVPEDYRLPGTIVRVSSSIHAGGTGEVIYEQGGVRQVVAARASSDEALPRGTEVIILRIDRGIAIVEVFDDFAKLDDDGETPPSGGGGLGGSGVPPPVEWGLGGSGVPPRVGTPPPGRGRQRR